MAAAVKGASTETELNRKLTFLIDLVTSGVWTRFTLFAAILLLALIVGAIFFGVAISEQAHVRMPSFILLTKKSSENKIEELSRLNKKWYLLVGTFVGAMSLGVLSNALFYLALRLFGLPS